MISDFIKISKRLYEISRELRTLRGGHHQKTFFDVRVFNPTALSYRSTVVSSLYRRFEREKQRMYEQRVRDVEMSSFTPLVFSTFGGIGVAATTVTRDWLL